MKKYKQINIDNFKHDKYVLKLPKNIIEDIEIVGQVLPFRANNYVTKELINWDSYETDPIFHLCFPQREMLSPENYQIIKNAIIQKYIQF